jgi:peptidoglycan/LPS O-acetylase OafA/YrhL
MLASLPGARFTLVDALRGVAALAVVLFHAAEGNHIPNLLAAAPWLGSLLSHGHLGVAIFFVLSGFVIAHATYLQAPTIGYLGRFMLRRSIRLDPPYWIAIAIAVAFAFLSALVVRDKPWPEITWDQIAAHAFYLQDILGYHQLNTVFWTLCLEVQFYFVYVVLLCVARSAPSESQYGTVTCILLACGCSLLWPLGVIGPYVPWPGTFPTLWHGFLVGSLAYWAIVREQLAPAFWIFATAVAAIAVLHDSSFSLVCALTAATLVVASRTGALYKGANWRWIQLLGLISYSLYLLHNPVTGASFRVGYMITGRSIAMEILWWLVSILACIAAAAVMYRLIEQPSIALSHKVRQSVPTKAH